MTEAQKYRGTALSLGAELPESALTPVFFALRISLHSLVAGLTALVIVRALLGDWSMPGVIVALSVLFLGGYIAGAFAMRGTHSRGVVGIAWLSGLLLVWFVLTLLAPEAAYLVFPLFFVELHLLRARWAIPVVALSVAAAIWALSRTIGLTAGTVIGPLIGAGVAIALGLAYRAMYREAVDRQRLIDELVSTRTELAVREREAGVAGERQRLAREIHDTVAQGLSSIRMLLHAAERDMLAVDLRLDETPKSAHARALTNMRLARDTASDGLAEARRFVRELTPPALEEQSIVGALSRLATVTSEQNSGARPPLRVSLQLSGSAVPLSMPIETTLLRVAQGSLANVVNHAAARSARLTLSFMDDTVALDIVDDGRGFEVGAQSRTSGLESFGLRAMSERIAALGGTVTVESVPGSGTAVAVTIPLAADLTTLEIAHSHLSHSDEEQSA